LDGPDVRKTADELGKKHDMEYLHVAFKLRTRGGLGVGCGRAPFGVRDSIELVLIDLARPNRPVPPPLLGPNRNELIAVARTTEAIAALTYAHTPQKAMPNKDPAVWTKSNDDVILASRQLAEAARLGDAKAIKAAAVNVTNACNACHEVWRD